MIRSLVLGILSLLIPCGAMASGIIRIVTTQGGQLETLLGENKNSIDSLAIAGPIDNQDFQILFNCSRNGILTYLDLLQAQVSENKIPTKAFWEENVPYNPESKSFECKLQHVIFPENLEIIGRQAFKECRYLEKVEFPISLRILDGETFAYCYSLKGEFCILPPNLEILEAGDFVGCTNLRSIEIPSSVKIIGRESFLESYIDEIILNEGLEEIGFGAFANCNIVSISIPSTCLTLGDYMFFESRKLEKILLPEGVTYIPSNFTTECQALIDVNIPSTVKIINDYGLNYARLKSVILPEGLEEIGINALPKGSFSSIILPPNLIEIGAKSCLWTQLSALYSQSIIPPICGFVTETLLVASNDPSEVPELIVKECGPFGITDKDFDYFRTNPNIPIYIPIGSKALYENAPGWNYFSNFIEIEEFPNPASTTNLMYTQPDGEIYDVSGRIIKNPVRGKAYIKNRQKFLFK